METQMKAGALVDASSRDQELRYVTAHFRDLQGLRMAPLWVALLVLIGLAKHRVFGSGRLAWAAVIFTVMQFGWLYVSGHLYERHYGVVKEPEPAISSGLISIMHPEGRISRASNHYYGYHQRQAGAVIFLIWTLTMLPDFFRGHARPADFAMLITAFQIVPRCFYSVTNNWRILLRRLIACAALLAIVGLYVDYRFARMELWTWMASLLSLLLLLDLYDHWLLNHLLAVDLVGGSYGRE
jgi:hypothetical protein